MRTVGRLAVAILTAAGVYVAVLVYPQPLFAYELDHAGIIVHATRPIPGEMRTTLERARARLDRGALRDQTQNVHVFMCDSPWLFAVFARSHYRVGGIANVYIGRHVFLRQSDMVHDRLISPSGKPVPDDRPLSYFIAHEVMHIAHGRALGMWGYFRLPQWVDDGDADYVGRDLDPGKALRGFHAGVPELDPARSGLYIRWALMVGYVLQKEHVDIQTLLQTPPDGVVVERALTRLQAW